jgi:hypothetical protein
VRLYNNGQGTLNKGSPHRAAYIARLLGDKIVTTKAFRHGVPGYFGKEIIQKYMAIESIKKF